MANQPVRYMMGHLPDPYDPKDKPFFSSSEVEEILSDNQSVGAVGSAPQKPPVQPNAVPVKKDDNTPTPIHSLTPAKGGPQQQTPIHSLTPAKDIPTPIHSLTPAKDGPSKVPVPKPIYPPKTDPKPPQPGPKPDTTVVPPPTNDSKPASSEDTSPRPKVPAGAFVLPNLSPIYDQGGINSCGANASCAALRYAYVQLTGKPYKEYRPSRLFTYYFARLMMGSTLMYPTADPTKEISPAVKIQTDSGCQLRGVMHSFLVHGACKEELWPYGTPAHDDETLSFIDTNTKPNPCEPLDISTAEWQARSTGRPAEGNLADQTAFIQGDAKYVQGQNDMMPRAISYYRIYNPTASQGPNTGDTVNPEDLQGWGERGNLVHPKLLEHVLSRGFPFVFGMLQFPDKADLKYHVDKDGVFAAPPTDFSSYDPKQIGSHAIMAVGFDSARQLFLIQNSWGTAWPAACEDASLKGFCWVPYSWFTSIATFPPPSDKPDQKAKQMRLTSDHWVIRFGD